MLRKLTLALVASASLGAAAAAPTAASASPYWHPHHHHHLGLGFVVGGGYGGDSCYQARRVWTPYGFRFRVVNVCAW